jgi:hypothetical protein
MLLTAMIHILIRIRYWIASMQQDKADLTKLPRVIILNPVLGEWGQLTILKLPQGVNAICWMPEAMYGLSVLRSITQKTMR